LARLGDKSNVPGYLYHYTRPKTFRLILETRKVRFNRLDLVRDLTEGKSTDLGSLGIYQFVSCWTDCSDESIEVWSVYTPRMSGVRIGFPSDMLETYEQKSTRYKGIQIEPGTRHVLPLDERIRDNFLVGPLPAEFPHRMVYTDDPDLLAPRVAEEPDILQFGRLGISKSPDWAFESEWRFRLFVMPHPVPPNGDFADPQFAKSVGERVREIFHARSVSDSGLFCTISPRALRDMEVVLGPCLGKSERSSIEQLLGRLNSDCRIRPSRFTGRIRCD
jgi:hypothetical protein